jgi:hypothetical protein
MQKSLTHTPLCGNFRLLFFSTENPVYNAFSPGYSDSLGNFGLNCIFDIITIYYSLDIEWDRVKIVTVVDIDYFGIIASWYSSATNSLSIIFFVTRIAGIPYV